MPGGYKGRGPGGGYNPPRASLKAKGSILKYLKDNDQLNVTHIEKLIYDSYLLQYTWQSLDESYTPFLNKPDGFQNLSEKAGKTLSNKFDTIMTEILMSIPEYAEKINQQNKRNEYIEYCHELGYTHFGYGKGYSDYESNQKQMAFKGMISHLSTHTFKNQEMILVDLRK